MLIDTIWEREFLKDSWIVRFFRVGRRVPSSPITSCKDVAAAVRPHGLPGMVSSQGSDSSSFPSVAAEVLLVRILGQSSKSSTSVGGVALNDLAGPLARKTYSCSYLLGECRESISFWVLGGPLQVPLSLLLYTSALRIGCGAHLQNPSTTGAWSWEEKELHISVLEMKTVWLALNTFLTRIAGDSFLLMNGSVTVMSYLNIQGDTISRDMCSLAQEIVAWLELCLVTILARCIPKQTSWAVQTKSFPLIGPFSVGCSAPFVICTVVVT